MSETRMTPVLSELLDSLARANQDRKRLRREVGRLRGWLRIVRGSASIAGSMSAAWVDQCCCNALAGKSPPRGSK